MSSAAQLDVDPPPGRVRRQAAVAADEGVLELGCHRADGKASHVAITGVDHVQVAAPPGCEEAAAVSQQI